MFKNCLKSACWLVYYFVLQVVASAIVVVAHMVNNPSLYLSESGIMIEDALANGLSTSVLDALLVSAILFCLSFALYKKFRNHSFDFRHLHLDTSLYMICFGLILNFSISFVLGLIIIFLPKSLVDAMNASTGLVLHNESFITLLLSTGIFVPLMEEMVFRYGICGTLSRKNKAVGLIVSSVVFGLMHGNVIQGVYTGILGIVLGLVYLKYENIWYPSFIHMAINSSSVIVSYFEHPSLLLFFAVNGAVGMFMLSRKNPELTHIFRKNTLPLPDENSLSSDS